MLLARTLKYSFLKDSLALNAMEAINKYLDYDSRMSLEEEGSIKKYFVSIGGVECIEALKETKSYTVYEYLTKLLEAHFPDNVGDLDDTDFYFS